MHAPGKADGSKCLAGHRGTEGQDMSGAFVVQVAEQQGQYLAKALSGASPQPFKWSQLGTMATVGEPLQCNRCNQLDPDSAVCICLADALSMLYGCDAGSGTAIIELGEHSGRHVNWKGGLLCRSSPLLLVIAAVARSFTWVCSGLTLCRLLLFPGMEKRIPDEIGNLSKPLSGHDQLAIHSHLWP